MQYDPDNCPKQAKWACSMIRAKVKEMEFDRYHLHSSSYSLFFLLQIRRFKLNIFFFFFRYKIIILVTFGEKRGQDILYGIRFLWDAERDKFAMSTHENMSVFGIAMCIGIYYE